MIKNWIRILFVFQLALLCTSCVGKSGRGEVMLWKKGDIDFSKYKKVYYTVCNHNDIDNTEPVFTDLDRFFLTPLGFEFAKQEGKLIAMPDDYLTYIDSIKDKIGGLFVRSDLEYGFSIPPRVRREFDGFIWRHRTKTTIRLMDLQTQEDLATLKYERRYFDGKIPEEVLYKLLMKAIREKKDYLESSD